MQQIKQRLVQFRSLPESEYKWELIFCLLTPQSKAQKCWEAVEEIKKISEITEENIKEILIRKTRFHNNKAKYVIEAISNWDDIKSQLSNSNILELRSWLAENVKGMGLKEASHFLRNIGKSNNQIAILDRHILRNLRVEGVKSRKDYFEIEKMFLKRASDEGVTADELDLIWWSKENGEVFK